MKRSSQKKVRAIFLLLGLFFNAVLFTLTASAAESNRTLIPAMPAYAAAPAPTPSHTPSSCPTPPDPGASPTPSPSPAVDPDPEPDEDLTPAEEAQCKAAGRDSHVDIHPCSWYAEKDIMKIKKGYYCCEPVGPPPKFMLGYDNVISYIVSVYKLFIQIAIVLAALVIVLAGLRWMFARGNTGTIAEAKKMISNTLVGLILALGSYTLLYAINPDLVEIEDIYKNFNRSVKGIEQVRLKVEMSESPTASPDYVDEDKAKPPASIIERINQNMDLYKQVAQLMDVPWELLATTHFQEAANRSDKSILNGFDICNNKDSKCPECNEGKTQLNDARCAARILRTKARTVYNGYPNYTERSKIFCLTQATNDATDPHGALANTMFRYNGVCPHRSLEELRRPGTCLNVDESGYVMNNFSSDPQYQRMPFAGYVASSCKPGCTVFKRWSGDGGLRFFQRLKNTANFDASGKLIKLD